MTAKKSQHWQPDYPDQVVSSLQYLEKWQMPIFLAGGAVRDFLRGQPPIDLDITVPAKALDMAKDFAKKINGVFVLLDEQEDVARVVWRQFVIDFSSFREGAVTIKEDLQLRDFTINAMALPFYFESGCFGGVDDLIDPLHGMVDLKNRIIRFTSGKIFDKDPLRLLRAFRFRATLDFEIEKATEVSIRKYLDLISRVSAERISYELNIIILSEKQADCVKEMADIGLLFLLFPELEDGVGLSQPGSHHLDVFKHNLETLVSLVKIINNPAQFFKDQNDFISQYLDKADHRKWLLWASLFHDIGKPMAYKMRNDKITFYNHDYKGSDIFIKIAKRLKWSNRDIHHSAKFIKLHMWPFHLNNALKKTGIKPKACLKLYKAIGDDLAGLFILAMADSLAAEGNKKPVGMEDDLVCLLERIIKVIDEKIIPVSAYPPALTGSDLIKEFDLIPGPIFSEILENLEEVQVSTKKMNREEALRWVKNYLQR